MKDIQIDIPNFKQLKDKIKQTNFDFALLCNLVIYLIVIVIPCFPLTYNSRFTEQLKFTMMFSIFLIIFGISYFLLKNNKSQSKIKGKKIKLEVIDYLLITYIVLILLSSFTSSYFPDTLLLGANGRSEGLLTLLLYIFLFYVAYKEIRFSTKLLPHIATSSLIVSCYGIVQAMLPTVFTKYPYYAVSTFGNPNFLSSYLCIFLPIYIIAYLKNGNPFYLITSTVTFSCLVCAKTLGGYITFFMFFTVILIYVFRQKLPKQRLLAIVLLFISMFGILNLVTNNQYINELCSLKQEANIIQGNESLNKLGTGRGLIYKLGIEISLKNPWLGIGPDCLGQKILDEYWGTPVYTSDKLFDKAHSEYLHIAICTGIPSVCVYIAFVAVIGITILKKHFKNPQNTSVFAMGVSILSYLFQASANISVTHLAPIFWIMLGIGFNIAKSQDTKLDNI